MHSICVREGHKVNQAVKLHGLDRHVKLRQPGENNGYSGYPTVESSLMNSVMTSNEEKEETN